MTLEKSFDPAAIEADIYQRWEQQGYFAPRSEVGADSKPYTIMLPPPNVTGRLHMGHAFQHTIMDALTRFHRMDGDQTLWQPGTDHAGIATQMVVERQLNAQGKTRHDLGRETFVESVWDWKEQSGGMITQQMRRLGTSVDWQHERFTMDEGLSAAVRKVFVDLYDQGLIYRGKRLVNWDPVLHTALSDLEVLSEEESGSLWHLRYPRDDGKGHVVVATTRPETMLGDTAVAVHPDDERYQDLIGQRISLPLTDRTIPVIADEYVDPEFGSGCVKITPAHDFNDYDIGQRHQLPLINVLTDDAAMNDDVPEKYRGLDRFEARKLIVADFDALGLLEKIADHKLMVPRGDRSGAVVEPYLTDQWYVDLTSEVRRDGQPGPGGKAAITDPSIAAIENGDTKFVPANWDKTYYEWMRNIQDWCISRQLWWGHRIPAWYDDDSNIYVGHDEQDVRAKHGLGNVALRQDDDVLDTWFSAGLWPFSTLGWPEQTERLKTFYPTSVLVTGFDIIFFWVARMMMFGLKFMGEVPFKEVYITGLIRDHEGQKMSKSKGNILDPIDLIDGISLDDLLAKRTTGLMQEHLRPKIEKATRKEFPDGIKAFGTDALRFTFAALASTGRDIRFDMGRIEGYRNFCNKLWNATRYVLMNVEELPAGETIADDANARSVVDNWILARLQQTIGEAREHFENYRFDLLAQTLYEFTWNEYCDWYLELTKPILQSGSATQRAATRHTLLTVLETIQCLLHPIIPFITEELWQKIATLLELDGATISLRPYPKPDATLTDPEATGDIDWLKTALLGVRQIRGEMDISPKKPLPVLVEGGDELDHARMARLGELFSKLGKIESIETLDGEAPQSAVALLGTMKLHIPLAGLIDIDAEIARLEKELLKQGKNADGVRGRLSNDKFVNSAPEAVVGKAREQLAVAERAIAELSGQIEKLRASAG